MSFTRAEGREGTARDQPPPGGMGVDSVEAPAPGRSWTVLQLIRWSAHFLAGKGVPEPRLDAEHLLAHALDASRLDLYLQYDRPLEPEELTRFRPTLLERARRKPLQYVLGRAAFRELELEVDPRVLIPRPETEGLVEEVLRRVRGQAGLRALDVGTGSGAVALSLASEGPFPRVVATDTSAEALEVARGNAARLVIAGVELRRGSLLEPVKEGERFHVLVSNPPYVAREEYRALEPELREWEPEVALVAGPTGLEVLTELVVGAPEVLHPGGLLALEVGADQAAEVVARVRTLGELEGVEVSRDLSGRRRYVLAKRAGGRSPDG